MERSTNQFHVDLPFTCRHDQKWLFDPLWQAAICLNHPMVMLLLLIAPDLHCHLHILGFCLGEMHQSCGKLLSTVTLCPVATSEINSLHRSVHTSASLELSGKEGLCVWGGGKETVPIWWLQLLEAHSLLGVVCSSLPQRFQFCFPPATDKKAGQRFAPGWPCYLKVKPICIFYQSLSCTQGEGGVMTWTSCQFITGLQRTV